MKFLTIALMFLLSTTSGAEQNKWEGVPLPEFSLKDQTGNLKSNINYQGSWLVLYFYPKDKTPGCTVEAQNFTDDYSQYKKLNTKIVGVSYDDVNSHKDFSDTYEMPFTLLADTEKKLAKSLNVDSLFPWPHASRQTFIINPKGIIVKHFSKVDPDTHSKKLLKDLIRLQTVK